MVKILFIDSVLVALLSQGTMNAYYHSARLPSVEQLPGHIQSNSYR